MESSVATDPPRWYNPPSTNNVNNFLQPDEMGMILDNLGDRPDSYRYNAASMAYGSPTHGKFACRVRLWVFINS